MKKRFIGLLLTFCLIMVLIPSTAWAAEIVDSGICGDDLTWSLDKAGTLTISGTGPMADYTYSSAAPWFSYRESITALNIGSDVTSIGDFAFYRCRYLGDVEIPDSVQNVGMLAFNGCGTIEKITIGSGLNSIGELAFDCGGLLEFSVSTANSTYCSVDGVLFSKDMTQLIRFPAYYAGQYVIPDEVQDLERYAFSDSSRLTSIVLPEGLASISFGAFRECSVLESIYIPLSVKSIEYAAFQNSGIKHIWYAGTSDQWSNIAIGGENDPLSTAEIHYSADDIGQIPDSDIHWAISEDGTLTISGTGAMPNRSVGVATDYYLYWELINRVVVENGITSIGDFAFQALSYVTEAEIADSVQSIGIAAFGNCRSLVQISFGSNVRSIGHDAFSGCSNLEEVYYGGSEKQWNEISVDYHNSELMSANIHFSATDSPDYSCGDNLKWSIDGNTLNISGTGAMYDYSETSTAPWMNYMDTVQSIVIEDGATHIGNYAFWQFAGVKSAVIPDSVKTIGILAFNGDGNLESVTIGSGISKIGTRAFNYCLKLSDVYYNGTEEQWDAVTVESNNDPLQNAAFHYREATAPIDPTRPDEPQTMSFTDVPENAYYTDAVAWAVKNNITAGTSSTTFSPNDGCTRAQVVTFLWRAAGSPEVSNDAAFSDVPAGQYYTKAVAWAVANNITAGIGNGKFAPNDICTRGQIVTFLWRYENSPATSGGSFSDVPSSAFYAEPVAWAVANGITVGVGNNRFAPNDTCTRAQIVTFLYRDMIQGE